MIPAECFPVGEYIADELEARGWTTRDLAERMGGDVDLNQCTIELTIACGVSHPQVSMGTETAQGLSRAFGTSADVWLNLDRAYRECREHRAKLESA